MSIEFCNSCSRRIDTDTDTDYNVEGEVRAGKYMCERCCERTDADCARYRWLRATCNDSAETLIRIEDPEFSWRSLCGSELDAAIDKAMVRS